MIMVIFYVLDSIISFSLNFYYGFVYQIHNQMGIGNFEYVMRNATVKLQVHT